MDLEAFLQKKDSGSNARGGDRIVEMGPVQNSRTSGKEVRNIQKCVFAFRAILRVIAYIAGISVMPKIA